MTANVPRRLPGSSFTKCLSPRGTILLVDDNHDARRTLRRALEKADFRVLEARGGGHALRMFDLVVGDVDVLIAEVAISAPNGVALAEAFNAWWPSAAVILMSDQVIAGVTYSPGSRRVQRVLRRPVPLDQLVDAARRALDAR